MLLKTIHQKGRALKRQMRHRAGPAFMRLDAGRWRPNRALDLRPLAAGIAPPPFSRGVCYARNFVTSARFHRIGHPRNDSPGQ
jgi:hypothetical protein